MPESENLIQDGVLNIDVALTPIDQICQTINGTLSNPISGYAPALYSEATRQLFLGAWTLAAQQDHNQVSEDHILVALLSSDPTIKETLGRIAGDGPLDLQIGALVRVARLGSVVEPEPIEALPPTELVVKWIGEAGRYATSQNDGDQLEPMDFVNVLDCQECDPSVRTALRGRLSSVKKAGHLRSQLAKTLQASESTRQTAGFHRSNSRTAFEELDSKFDQLATQVVTGQGSIEIAQLSNLTGQIASVENGIANVRADLPRPPAAGLLLFSIAGVLALGIAVGVALNNPSYLEPAIAEIIQQVNTITTGWKQP